MPRSFLVKTKTERCSHFDSPIIPSRPDNGCIRDISRVDDVASNVKDGKQETLQKNNTNRSNCTAVHAQVIPLGIEETHRTQNTYPVKEDIKSSPTSKTLVACTGVPSHDPSRVVTSEAPAKLQCPNCMKGFNALATLMRHQYFYCPPTQHKRPFHCKYCEKLYDSLGALKMHIRTHTLPCKCKICGKAFSRPWLLQGHVRTHTGEKPYKCTQCQRAFADRSNLRAHLQTHSDVKKYSCKQCSKSFSRMSLLLKHEGSCSGASSAAMCRQNLC
ncbi:predicted protein [Nematostella vectensis]|uniref:Snail n=1 Tax=Nematostella vectensis TaxID=45351 RepID=Q6WGJ9_NEMVE|nr:protein snail homolog Sna [Nematostella vectensis]AAQ23385.1 snail [Nematostella vectensis]EDO49073.1 predicted protein [Nematostella vectensis]|eukprot:XP_001641136.1 predicted protein [Nematostella vectensis]